MSEVISIPGNFPREKTIAGQKIDVVEKDAQHRYGNNSKVRMEIRYGRSDDIFELVKVHVDYLKTP